MGRTGLSKALIAGSAAISLVALGMSSSYADLSSRPVSKFKHGTEKWTVVGDPTSTKPKFFKHGGHPGGYVETTDAAQGGIMYWSAPAKFLGNQASAYGGTLQFDLRSRESGFHFDASDVILKGGAVRLTYDTASDPTSAWTRYSVPLSQAGWMKGDVPASKADMLACLGSLKTVLIRAEFASHTETDDLDNVIINQP